MKAQFLTRFRELRLAVRQEHFWLDTCKELKRAEIAYTELIKTYEKEGREAAQVAFNRRFSASPKIKVEMYKTVASTTRAMRKILAKTMYGRWDSILPSLRNEILPAIASRRLALDSREVRFCISEAAEACDGQFLFLWLKP